MIFVAAEVACRSASRLRLRAPGQSRVRSKPNTAICNRILSWRSARNEGKTTRARSTWYLPTYRHYNTTSLGLHLLCSRWHSSRQEESSDFLYSLLLFINCSKTTTMAGLNSPLAKPMSVKEIAEKAQEFEFDPHIALKYWLRTAETLLREVC